MTQLTEMSAADWQQWRATMAQWMGGVSLWSTRQGALDAERLHAKQREATLTGERDAALQRVAELEATVAGLQARLDQAIDDMLFYYQLFQDAQKGG
jgi:hypothetical protein